MTNNSSLPCDIVQDLLPSYADGILSDTGTAVVAKHLQSCEHCHDIYHAMVNDEPHKATSDQQEKEIDYLKKVRSKTRHFTITAILIAVLLAGSGTAVYFLFFSGEYILNSVKYNLQVSSNSLKIEGILPDDFTTTSQKIEEKNGVVSLTLPAKRKTFFSFHKNYEVSYTAKATIREVRVNGDILWQNGELLQNQYRIGLSRMERRRTKPYRTGRVLRIPRKRRHSLAERHVDQHLCKPHLRQQTSVYRLCLRQYLIGPRSRYRRNLRRFYFRASNQQAALRLDHPPHGVPDHSRRHPPQKDDNLRLRYPCFDR